MLQIDTVARILIDVQIPFNYRVAAFKKEIEVIRNGRIKPFLVVQYSESLKMVITNNKGEVVEPTDLLHSLSKLLSEAS